MTSHLDPSPQPPPERPSSTRKPADTTTGDAPRVAGLVPITVWRLDDHDVGQPPTQPGAGFASGLAWRLILTYTSHGDTVVDFDHDPHVHGAATRTGRAYLAITDPDRLPVLDQIRNPVSLVTLRWPRPAGTSTGARIAALLTACRPIMSEDASVIAALRPSHPPEPGPSFADHEQVLRAAVEGAGFTHVLQIVAMSAPGEGDQFLYYATETEAVQAARRATIGDRLMLLIDLLVFHRHGRP
jgi:hypothetical protein